MGGFNLVGRDFCFVTMLGGLAIESEWLDGPCFNLVGRDFCFVTDKEWLEAAALEIVSISSGEIFVL